VAQALELRDEAFGLAFGVAAGVVVAAEVVVDLAGSEHVLAGAVEDPCGCLTPIGPQIAVAIGGAVPRP
jgi:hypothetical protein